MDEDHKVERNMLPDASIEMKISVVIPVKNGALTLERCLQSIVDQSVLPADIVVLDSGSTDNSREIALKYGAKLIPVDSAGFNHGLTRNLGTLKTSGQIVFFTVQDSFLANDRVLETMASHFENPEVMGVVGHQAVPHDRDKNPLLWFRRYSEPKPTLRKLKEGQHISSMHDTEKRKLIAWDNVVAMYRKKALEILPFAKTNYAEDWIWSAAALEQGWVLVHEPSAVVYHYHHQGFRYAYKANFAMHYAFYQHLQLTPVLPNFFMKSLKAGYQIAKNKEISFREKLRWMRYNLATDTGNLISSVDLLVSIRVFGKKYLQWRYEQVCKIIPQGRQNESGKKISNN